MKRKAPSKDIHIDTESSSSDAIKQSKPSIPDYGSKEYWEARYKSNLLSANDDINTASTNADEAEQGTRIVDGIELSTEVQAGHAWYFSYEELRPLILRLVVDCDDDKEEVKVDDYLSDEGSDGWEEVGDESVDVEGLNDAREEEDEEPNSDAQSDSEAQETESTDGIDSLEAYLRQSTSESHPKTVLEIGCGDAPLGSSLTSELNSLQSSTGCNVRNIVSSVECVDYSKIVIDELKKQQQQEVDVANHSKEQYQPLYPKYTASDARQLPHAPNSISIILEKGTLDAMLSHPTEGVTNSIAMVKEMARVCKIGGAILIVSHLNARTGKGMGWVTDVLLVGLKEEWVERRKIQKQQLDNSNGSNSEVLWSIEVHGREEAKDEDNSEEDSEEHESSYGPAVYILKKKGVASSIFQQIMEKKKQKSGDDNEDSPPVKLEFLSYS
jgi:ubiquinone/menaquinone biosynthesis C-methylase UbiE